jgi:hypothetical protein
MLKGRFRQIQHPECVAVAEHLLSFRVEAADEVPAEADNLVDNLGFIVPDVVEVGALHHSTWMCFDKGLPEGQRTGQYSVIGAFRPEVIEELLHVTGLGVQEVVVQH